MTARRASMMRTDSRRLWRCLMLVAPIWLGCTDRADSVQQNSSRSAAASEQQRREGEQLRLMVEELAPIQKQCDETEPTQTVPIRGTVLVWSVYEGRRLTGMEPVGLSATDLKAAMTVFLVRTKRRDRGFFLTNANDQYQTVAPTWTYVQRTGRRRGSRAAPFSRAANRQRIDSATRLPNVEPAGSFGLGLSAADRDAVTDPRSSPPASLRGCEVRTARQGRQSAYEGRR